MKLLNEKILDLKALYVKELRVLLSAEEMIAIKTQYLADSAADRGLVDTLENQVEESEARAKRLREILQHVGDEVQPVKCKVVYALFDDAEDIIKNAEPDGVRDAAVLAAAQRVKHFEIASYGSVREFARALERKQEAELLDEAVYDEGRAELALAKIGERINPVAGPKNSLNVQDGDRTKLENR